MATSRSPAWLTSASVHASQVAIPLASLTAVRVTSLYDLMDGADDAAEIEAHSRSLGHVPIIAISPCRQAGLKGDLAREGRCRTLLNRRLAQDARYGERANADLKDNQG